MSQWSKWLGRRDGIESGELRKMRKRKSGDALVRDEHNVYWWEFQKLAGDWTQALRAVEGRVGEGSIAEKG